MKLILTIITFVFSFFHFCSSTAAWAWTPSSSSLSSSLSTTTTPRSIITPKFRHVSSSSSRSSSPTTLLSSTVPNYYYPPPLPRGSFSPNKVQKQYNDNNVFSRIRSTVRREFEMTCGLLQSDMPVTIVLGSISAIAFGIARSTSPLTAFGWVSLVFKAFFWFLGYGYHFDIGNQITGVEEDKLNNEDVSVKANRPLATGAMSIKEGKVRHILSGLYYVGVSLLFGGMDLALCALLWIVSSQLYNFHGWDSHFVTKNYCTMSTGSIAMLLGARTIAGETQLSMIPSILAAVWIGLCMDSQDLRDEAGDCLSGRSTTSVLWGVETARKAWVGMTTLSTGLLMYIMRNSLSWPDAVIVGWIVGLMGRTLRNKTAKEDHNTYNGICLAGAAFFVRSAFWAHSF